MPTHSSLVAVAHNTQPRPLLGSSKQCNNARDALLRLPEGCERERETEGEIANKLAGNTFAESTTHNRIAEKFDGKAG